MQRLLRIADIFLFSLLLIAGAFLLSCSKEEKSEVRTVDSDAVQAIREVKTEELISHLPAEILSSKEPIRIRFLDKQASDHQIGIKIKKQPLTFEPDIKGHLEWEDAYTLAFYPEEQMTAGKKYNGELDVEKLLGTVSTKKTVAFTFRVASQEIKNVNGNFYPSPEGKPDEVYFQVVINFLEPESPQGKGKQILLLKDKKKIKVDISQGDNDHNLVIRSGRIKRTDNYQIFTIVINKKLAGTQEYQQTYSLSPAREFALSTSTVIEQEEELGVDFLFSDPLDFNRDLTGFLSCDPEVSIELKIKDRVLQVRGPFERGIEYQFSLREGIPSSFGSVTLSTIRKNIKFKHLNPDIKFDQSGIILPFDGKRSISFRSVNLDSVVVTVEKVFTSNLGQFLQINRFEAQSKRTYRYGDMRRVATEVHKQVLIPNKAIDKWVRSELDLGALIDKERKSLFAVNLQYYYENQRRYRRYIISKMLISTDLGITVKKAGEKLHVYVTSIHSVKPIPRVKVVLYSFQLQQLAEKNTDSKGHVVFENDSGFYVAAEKGEDRSYIRTDHDTWKINTFETGGVEVHPDGINAYIYTDRGVYRPGDIIHLSCITRNQEGTFPDDHPVTLKLWNPRGQQTASVIQKQGKQGLYCFDIPTQLSDMTGTWRAELLVGDRSFQKNIKIETVIPNRLKVEIAFSDTVTETEFPVSISSKWLFGTPASGLKSKTELRIRSVEKTFRRYPDFIFSNPGLSFSEVYKELWAGNLDAEGKASFTASLPSMENVPSALEGFIKTRVFEKGGNFTDEIKSIFVDPYSFYAGIRPLKTRWGNIRTGQSHNIPLIVLDREGTPVSGHQLFVKVYRNDRYWWWDFERNQSQRFRYRRDRNTLLVSEHTIVSGNTPVQFKFEPGLHGQYFIEATDEASGHSTGMFVYVSSWGGDVQDLPQRADVVKMSSDRKIYNPGQTATITVETPSEGKALVTLEKANTILWSRWLDMDERDMTFEVPITKEMLPNVYVSVSQIQPRTNRKNDLPLRMYGIIPLMVEEPETRLPLFLDVKDELRPNEKFEVELEIVGGREGYATVAVVDEGLLDLTDFETPHPWDHFYAKEKLSVLTSDLFDLILDEIRGTIGQRYTIGGDYARRKRLEPQKAKRFKPVALFSGPVHIQKGKTAKVSFTMPNYIGAVRVMAVVISENSYTSEEKTVPVKSPLMVLPTVPRVIGPGEIFDLPVTVFAMEKTIKKAEVSVAIDSFLTITGKNTQTLTFNQPGDQLAFFRVKAEEAIGVANISVMASSNGFDAQEQISLSVRPSNPFISFVQDTVLTSNTPLSMDIPKVGIRGTNSTRLVVSAIPDMNITPRLNFLIRYPHGCIEQTTSAAFPQLYLKDLLSMDGVSMQAVDRNINTCIQSLRKFQLADGSFTFWPGGSSVPQWSWAHAYAGHFLLAAREKGYYTPERMLEKWISSTQRRVRTWPKNNWEYTVQAYELFLLAYAGRTQMGMMNWMREDRADSLNTTAGWLLATAYHISGKNDIAQRLLANMGTEIAPYREFGMTYGSNYRDRALILYLATIMDRQLDTARLLDTIVKRFRNTRYFYSTQETGMTLLALSYYLEKYGSPDAPGKLKLQVEGLVPISFTLKDGRYSTFLTGAEGKSFSLTSDSTSPLYVTLQSEGVPLKPSIETANYGVSLEVEWLDDDGMKISPESLKQGTTFWGHYSVAKSYGEEINELALTAVLPSGWEIENLRVTGENRPEWMEKLVMGKEEYTDIRDDRINWYFDMPRRYRYGSRRNKFDFCVKINVTYSGEFQLPAASLDAMYNPEYFARIAGKKVVVKR